MTAAAVPPGTRHFAALGPKDTAVLERGAVAGPSLVPRARRAAAGHGREKPQAETSGTQRPSTVR
ncbi:hypothetical protein GCM10010293_07930 [Streptomyces griseoflavus]|nr:hypothetical protein GCM10010293_07930 [Streptomyces griseoflavus]